MSKPSLSTSFLNQEVTCSPADRAEWSGSAGVSREDARGEGMVPTWSAQLAVLLLLAGVHVHAPGVEGEGEEVLQARGGTHHGVQALQPFLTLLEGGELTPGGSKHAVPV